MLIMVFKGAAFKEYVLPNVDNIDYSVVLDKNLFGLFKDIELHLENKMKKWYITADENDYSLSVSELVENQTELCDEKLIDILTINREILNILSINSPNRFMVSDKFRLTDNITITVGSGSDNLIRYCLMNLVSSSHCQISFSNGTVSVYDMSSNGVFVNHRKISGSCILKNGDTINIFGLNILFLGNIMCIGTSFGKVDYSDILNCYRQKPIKRLPASPPKKHEMEYFNRSPRMLPNINDQKIVIEPPPAPQFSKRKPLFNIIGPSFTMAIPMMIGTGIALFSSMYSGRTTGAFMFTGIITAVGSAVLGAVWAVLNLRQTRREELERENDRYEAYGKYLIDLTSTIREKYLENEKAMHQMYPSPEICCSYDSGSSVLWNRNFNQKDFLFCRLGLGNIPFQVSISVPNMKFSMVQDELKEKLEMIYEQFRQLHKVPVGIDLMDKRLVGIVGKQYDTYGIIDDIVAQIAANNSYTDVKIAFCSDDNYPEGANRWNYIKYLPHTWSSNGQVRYFASNKEETADMLYELVSVIRHRAEDNEKHDIVKPHYILIITDFTLLQDELITKYVFSPDKNLGLTTLIVSENRDNLPNNCHIIVERSQRISGIYDTLSTQNDMQAIEFDRTDLRALESFSKRLADIHINEIENGTNIPSKLDFMEMLGVSSLQELHVLESWRKNRTYNNMRAVIGKKSGGLDCCLDIYEKYHGPHGLVAGTTGSGKSEILQTYILSMAVNFSPEDIAFFLIDFKGGGMANLFTGLPHLIGSISNLAGNQIRRAMISIKSENKRRQRLFNEYGVNNIDAYTRLYKNGEAASSIPHLIIIIDEFAEMKREGSDEYMRELISVAQVGRSLGVHLILATQKPSGTVSDDIWSNSKFKLCLRVQDRKDSSEMLHKPDAAYITQAGRCYLQVGNDEIYELFQSGWSGAVYEPDSMKKRSSIATMITSTGKTAVVGNYTKLKRLEKDRRDWYTAILRCVIEIVKENYHGVALTKLSRDNINDISVLTCTRLRANGFNFAGSDVDIRCIINFISLIPDNYKNENDAVSSIIEESAGKNIRMPELKDKTQLETVVEYIADLAAKNGYSRQNSLWLPELSDKILLADISETADNFDGTGWHSADDVFSLKSVFGMYDDPENQSQLPLELDIAKSGHIALCGSVFSGKSTFIQTFVYSLMIKYEPSEINFYFIDYSSNMLKCFEGSPHTGGVMDPSDPDKTDKFFNMIMRMIAERKKLFGGGNYAQYIKTTDDKMPVIMIVIDNYANFKDKTANKHEPDIVRISREGLSYGIYLMISSAGFGISEIPNKIGDNMKYVICLEMGDKYKYAEIFKGKRATVLPESGVKGRGLAQVDDRLLEFQTTLAVDAPDDYKRGDIIRAVCNNMSKAWKGTKARAIPVIPHDPTLSDLRAHDGYDAASKSTSLLPYAYMLSDASVYSVDLRYSYCYTILGKQHTGKTNILRLLMDAAFAKNGNIAVFEKSTQLLRQTAAKYNARYIDNDKGLYEYLKNDLSVEFVKRNKMKHGLLEKGMTEDEIFAVMSKEKPVFIFIDNFAEFIRSAAHPEEGAGEMAGMLNNLFAKGSLHNIYFFACVNTDDYGAISTYPMYRSFVQYKCGILLGGNINSQRVFTFQNISFNEMSKSMKRGIGLTPSYEDESAAVKVIIPLVGREDL